MTLKYEDGEVFFNLDTGEEPTQEQYDQVQEAFKSTEDLSISKFEIDFHEDFKFKSLSSLLALGVGEEKLTQTITFKRK